MSNNIGKLISSFVIFYIVAFLLFYVYQLVFPGGDIFLLGDFTQSYDFYVSLQRFINFIPTVQVSAIAIVFSWFFSGISKPARGETKDSFFHVLRTVLVVSILLTCVTMCIQEIFLPRFQWKTDAMTRLSRDYLNYKNEAKTALEKKDLVTADRAAKDALLISDTDSEFVEFTDRIQRQLMAERSKVREVKTVEITETARGKAVVSAEELLVKAKKLFSDEKYFETHYYATTALNGIAPNSETRKECQTIIDDSWKMLNRVNFSLADNSAEIFAEKRRGFVALEERDFVGAYYIFKKLQETLPLDPDVNRMLQRSEEGLRRNYFFTDEITRVSASKLIRNVYFSAKKKNGNSVLVKIGGITAVDNNSGSVVSFMQDVSIIEYNRTGEPILSFDADHAKLVSQNFANSDTALPRLLLNSIDREREGVTTSPVFHIKPENFPEKSFYEFPISFKNLDMIDTAFMGPQAMSLPDLIRFVLGDEYYGYSFEIYFANLLERIYMPFFLVFMSLVAAIIGWRYRSAEEIVSIKFTWIFFIPLIILMMYFFLSILQYFFHVMIYIVIGVFSRIAFIVILVILFLLINGATVRFASVFKKK